MAVKKTALASCVATALLDLLASTLATLATAPREGTCDGAFFFCSFRDLLPLAVVRVLALALTTLATYFLTRKPRVTQVRSPDGCNPHLSTDGLAALHVTRSGS